MTDNKIADVLERFPFLSYGVMAGNNYLGVVQNSDNQLLSMYLIDLIPTKELRAKFLTLSSDWWWGSNRLIPINIYLQTKFRIFRPYLKHFSSKDFELLSGPSVSLQETIARRVRKRQITLVRRILD